MEKIVTFPCGESGWREQDLNWLRSCGLAVPHNAAFEASSGAMTVPTQPHPVTWQSPHSVYHVFNLRLKTASSGDTGGVPCWSPVIACRPGEAVLARASYVMRQNHGCITQLLIRLVDDGSSPESNVMLHAINANTYQRGGAQLWDKTVPAPSLPGRYTIDFLWDWQYTVADALAGKAHLPPAPSSTIDIIHVLLPWEKEKLIRAAWHPGRNPQSSMSSLPREVLHLILRLSSNIKAQPVGVTGSA